MVKSACCACAFCRHDPRVNFDPAVQRSIEISESQADFREDPADVNEARARLEPLLCQRNPGGGTFYWDPDWHPSITALGLLETIDDVWYGQVLGELNWVAAEEQDKKVQADLIREIFGNPFRPVEFDPAWLARNNGAVVKLADAIDQDRAYDRMPALAAALEQAGCNESAILAHCGQPGLI